MNKNEVKKYICNCQPTWDVYTQKSGITTWVDITTSTNKFFTLHITPSDGVGVSERIKGEIDLAGLEEVFDSIDQAVEFIEKCSK